MLQKGSWLDDVTGYGRIAVEPLEWLALEFLCFHMRAIDHEEIYCMLPDENPLNCAAAIHHAVARRGCGWIARLNGRPAACLGVIENFPGNWQIYSFGTDDYGRVAVAFKDKADKMIAYGRDHGMHRLECRSIAHHTDAHRYIALIGMRRECVLEKYGSRGQDYILFSRVW